MLENDRPFGEGPKQLIGKPYDEMLEIKHRYQVAWMANPDVTQVGTYEIETTEHIGYGIRMGFNPKKVYTQDYLDSLPKEIDSVPIRYEFWHRGIAYKKEQ